MGISLAAKVEDPYMKMWEAQNQVVAMLQFAPNNSYIWAEAGNLSAHLAVVLAARGEGNYFPDALAMFSRALRLEADVLPVIEEALKSLTPKKAPKSMAPGFKEAKKWVKTVRSWKGRPPSPEDEFIQFLHPDINGPGRCSKLCPSQATPVFPEMR